MTGESVHVTHVCKHCGDPVGQEAAGHWVHIHERGNGSRVAATWHELNAGRTALYRCQHTVPYGQNAGPGEPIAQPEAGDSA